MPDALRSAETPYLALTHLLEALEQVADEHPELYDTFLREVMAKVLTQGFVHADPHTTLPNSFGMYTPEADAKVTSAFEAFFAELDLTSPEWRHLDQTARLLILRDETVRTRRGQTLPDFIGFYLKPSHVVGN